MLYLSFTWEKKYLGMIKDFNEELLENGIPTEFEETRIAGNIDDLSEYVDKTDLIVAFVTRKYVQEIVTPHIKDSSFVRRELLYGKQYKGEEGVVFCVIEKEVFTPEFEEAFNKFSEGSKVLDFTDDFDIDALLEVWKEREASIKEGRAGRAPANSSFVEGNVDWENEIKDLFYADGKLKYKGPLLFGKMEGNGIYFFKNGDRYEGMFSADFFTGEGTFFFKDGSKFVGGFKYDKREGFGRSYRADGTLKFEGSYVGGFRDGPGTVFTKSGEKEFDGVWERGALVEVTKRYIAVETKEEEKKSSSSANSEGSGGNIFKRLSRSLGRGKGSGKEKGSTVRIGKFKVEK